MECITIGDLHLTDSSGLGGLSKYLPDADLQVMREVAKVFKYAEKKGIKTIIFKGDICENPRMSYEAWHAFISFLKSKLARAFDIYIIVGNHDMISSDSDDGHSLQLLPLFSLPHVRLIPKTEVVEIDDAPVNFMSWPDAKFRKKHFNVAHIEVKGSKLDSGRVIDDDSLSTSKAVGAVGHLHTPHRVRNLFYSGTLYQTNFGESKEKFFLHVDYKSDDDWEINFIPHKPKYTLHNVILSAPDDIGLIPTSPNDLVKVVIEDGCDLGDYQFGPNVVVIKAFKTKKELVAILSEDLMHGEELNVKSSDMFKAWLKRKKLKPKLAKRVTKLRKKILKGSK